MAHRNTRRAQEIKSQLIEKLGSKCELCPRRDDLQFDHREGSDWVLNKLSYLQRMNIYKQEVEQNKIRLLCGACNRKIRLHNGVRFQKTNTAGVPAERIPF